MHLGVNLRLAQVKAVAKVQMDCKLDAEDASTNSNHKSDNFDDYNTNNEPEINYYEMKSCDEVDEEPTPENHYLNRDIDLFVHELAKLFGHYFRNS